MERVVFCPLADLDNAGVELNQGSLLCHKVLGPCIYHHSGHVRERIYAEVDGKIMHLLKRMLVVYVLEAPSKINDPLPKGAEGFDSPDGAKFKVNSYE